MIHIQTIPALPMTRNQRDRAHWAKRKRELDEWKLMIANCPTKLKQQPGDPKRRIEIVFRKTRGPLSDHDNLVARAKAPLDAIVHRGWLLDDAPTFCVLEVREEIAGEAATLIAISDYVENREAA